jgi:hypothetical protein
VLLLAFGGFVIQADSPAIGDEEASSVQVDAEVLAAAPACQDSASGVSFQPALRTDLTFQLPSPAVQSAFIDLEIVNGQTVDCEAITGRIAFVQTGFRDAVDDPVDFLSTGVNCNFGGSSSFAWPDADGIYTCGQPESASPTGILIYVTASEDAVVGVFTNTVSIDLIANP